MAILTFFVLVQRALDVYMIPLSSMSPWGACVVAHSEWSIGIRLLHDSFFEKGGYTETAHGFGSDFMYAYHPRFSILSFHGGTTERTE